MPILRPAVADECLGQGAAALQEARGALVSPARLRLADLLDQHPVEVRAEHLVIAIRPLALVDDHREQLSAGQFLEQEGAPPPIEQLVAQVAGEAHQDARVHEEATQVVGQLREDVAGEVVAQQTSAGANSAEDPASLVGRLAPCREVEQLQPGGPTLRAAGEDGKLARGHRVAVEVAEQPLHLPRAEAEVVALDLQEVAGHAQAREVEVRSDARRGEDPQPWRRVVHQPAEDRLGSGALERVQVVDHEGGRTTSPLLKRACRVLHVMPAGGQPRKSATERSLEVPEHSRRIVVPGFRPVPGHGQAGRAREAGEEGRLASARRRDDKRQPMPLHGGRELGLETLPREGLGRRDAHLRRDHRGRLGTRGRRALGTSVVPLLWQRQAP